MKQKKTLIIEIKEDPTEDVVRAERRNLKFLISFIFKFDKKNKKPLKNN